MNQAANSVQLKKNVMKWTFVFETFLICMKYLNNALRETFVSERIFIN